MTLESRSAQWKLVRAIIHVAGEDDPSTRIHTIKNLLFALMEISEEADKVESAGAVLPQPGKEDIAAI